MEKMICLWGHLDFATVLPKGSFPDPETEIVKCTNCSLVMTNPFPSPKYQDTFSDMRSNPVAEKIANHILDKVKHLHRKGFLLDVGCGSGILVLNAKQRGYDALGLEIDKSACEHAKLIGAKVVNADVLKYESDKKFDIIVLNHVLEHIPNPDVLLIKLYSMLSLSGVLLIGLPNHDSAWRLILKKRWYPYQPTQHLWHFTPKTITKLLKKHNFRTVINLESVEHASYLKPFDVFFNLLKLGDNMYVFASKKDSEGKI